MIWWHGISSDDLRVVVERYPDVIMPSRKMEKISVPGRNGDLLIQQDAFENVAQRYEIYISAEALKLPTISHKVAEWLCVKGYQRLEDSYWLDTFRLAAFKGGAEITNVLNRFGRATIEFDCKPQRFFKSGDIYTSFPKNTIMHNPSPFTAKPLIFVTGSGAGTLTIGDKTISLTNTTNVTIDCDIMQVIRNGTSDNSIASGTFPDLPAGESLVTWTGGILGIKIKPRWWTI